MKNLYLMICLWCARVWRATMYPQETNIVMRSALSLKIIRGKNSKYRVKLFSKEWFAEMRNILFRGNRGDYGIVCRKLVTSIGVKVLADLIAGTMNSSLSAIPSVGTLNGHKWGTGTTAESVGQSSLIAPAAPTFDAEASVAGTKVTSVVGNNAKYISVATITAEGNVAITEHAICFIGDGILPLFDRSVFGAKNLVNTDQLQITYELTLQSGG